MCFIQTTFPIAQQKHEKTPQPYKANNSYYKLILIAKKEMFSDFVFAAGVFYCDRVVHAAA